MKVLKFGGTSVKNADRIRKVIKIVEKVQEKEACIVVVSAFGGITDKLIDVAHIAIKGRDAENEFEAAFGDLEARHLNTFLELSGEIKKQRFIEDTLRYLYDIYRGISLVKELTDKTLACITSFGERLSAYIITQGFCKQGLNAKFLDARSVILTNSQYLNAQVDFKTTNTNIENYFFNNVAQVSVVTGFIACDKQKNITTLGRGGSDYTASIFAAAMNVQQLEIWSDVDGLMTADPNKVKQAFTIKKVSYEEAMEISHFGAKVLYPPCLYPVFKKNIPLLIKNTFRPEVEGTLVTRDHIRGEKRVKGITSMKGCSLFIISGMQQVYASQLCQQVFQILTESQIEIFLVVQSSCEHSITFVVKEQNCTLVKQLLDNVIKSQWKWQKFAKVLVQNDVSLVTIVGNNMRDNSGTSGILFRTLGNAGINVLAISQGASQLNISFVIKSKDEVKANNLVHEAFFLSDYRVLHLYLVGVGTVGSTLLKQITHQVDSLRRDLKIDLRLMGIANSKKMFLTQEYIDYKNWKTDLENGVTKDIKLFLDTAIENNFRNSVFIDCTASDEVSNHYLRALENGIAVVTANKVAASGELDYYKKIKKISEQKGTRFLNETNVGAGLPVIETLQNMVKSGDKIQKIEAILSGTLNYILQNISREVPLSVALRQAQQKGFTEPDITIDISGIDVVRKIVILARELKLDLQVHQVEAEGIIPKEYFVHKDIEAFYEAIKKYDPIFDQKMKQAQKEGKRICHIATLENQRAQVGLKAIAPEHALFQSNNTDNVILFTSERYQENPLVIRGPGAGAEVTAAGVFADIIRVIN